MLRPLHLLRVVAVIFCCALRMIPATLKMSARPARDGDALKNDAPGKVSRREFLKTISPRELGGTE
jgi:hypothetical protein